MRFLQHFQEAFYKYVNLLYGTNQKATISVLLLQEEKIEIIIKPALFNITKCYEALNNLNYTGQINPFSDKSVEPGWF